MDRALRERHQVPGVKVTHPERVIYPDLAITKLDVVRYYDAISSYILPHLRGRPLTLVACPGGLAQGCQYLRHSKVWGPAAIRRVRIREKTKIGEYMIADTVEALLSLAQFNVLELHTWNSSIENVERPNRLVLDLDPGKQIRWPQVITAAKLVRRVLLAVDLECWVKTTGGRGLHIVVPIKPDLDWSDCLAIAKAFADRLVAQNPDLYTTTFRKIGREKKILIDYLRNNRTNTSVAAFSLRARPKATVSMPIAWTDLVPAKTPERYTMLTVERYLRADPWRDYWRSRQRLTAGMFKAAGTRESP